jgi:hypothetical protein
MVKDSHGAFYATTLPLTKVYGAKYGYHARRKRFFFEKKNQKTFAPLGRGCFQRHGLTFKKFLLLVLKRSAFLLPTR